MIESWDDKMKKIKIGFFTPRTSIFIAIYFAVTVTLTMALYLMMWVVPIYTADKLLVPFTILVILFYSAIIYLLKR